jgi:hypothetical protein
MRRLAPALLGLTAFWACELSLEALVVSSRWSSGLLDTALTVVGLLTPMWLAWAAIEVWHALRRPRPVDTLARLTVAAITVASVMAGVRAANHVRMAGMRACAARLDPLIVAVSQYERDHGAPPAELGALVPRYLPFAPDTGLGAYPKVKYARSTDGGFGIYGNRWIVFVETGYLLSWDKLVYLPNGNYPRDALGGPVEQLNAWGYVHE